MLKDPFNYGNPNLDSPTSEKPFVRSNAEFPDVPKTHLIDVCGELFSIADLEKMDRKYLTVCTECAGNSRSKLPYKVDGLIWDNRAVSNVLWSGPMLKDLLPKKPEGAVEVVFTSLDKEFNRSLPVDLVYNHPIIIAIAMFMKPLPKENGFPARLIVPGWYGMASVKWLDKIYFTDKPFEGEYQTNKYTYFLRDATRTPVTTILPKSIITNISVQSPCTVRGKAWAGNQIGKVEVLINDVAHEAKIVQRHGDYGWVLWELTVELAEGQYQIGSKATDKNGIEQPQVAVENYWGYGNNAIQYVGLTI